MAEASGNNSGKRNRPASSRALRGSVQAQIIDNREGKQRQRKPVECRFPFFLEKFVGAHLFALSPTSLIDDRGGGLSGLGAPECDRARDGSGPAPHGVPVIATLNDPLTVFVAHNFPHMMAPHHDDTDRGAARV